MKVDREEYLSDAGSGLSDRRAVIVGEGNRILQLDIRTVMLKINPVQGLLTVLDKKKLLGRTAYLLKNTLSSWLHSETFFHTDKNWAQNFVIWHTRSAVHLLISILRFSFSKLTMAYGISSTPSSFTAMVDLSLQKRQRSKSSIKSYGKQWLLCKLWMSTMRSMTWMKIPPRCSYFFIA